MSTTPVEIREKWDYHDSRWQPWRKQSLLDRDYAWGNPWSPEEQNNRGGGVDRPMPVFNEIAQYLNQVTNSTRTNPIGIKVGPDENGTNEETARIEESLIRQIEHRSSAQKCYSMAAENQFVGGYGFVKVSKKYLPKSFEQTLCIEQVENPDSISTDPDSKQPDNSDMMDAFEFTMIKKTEFRKLYKGAQEVDFGPEIESRFKGWLTPTDIRIASYWAMEKSTAEICNVQQPDGSMAVWPITPEVKIIKRPNGRVPGMLEYQGIRLAVFDIRLEDTRIVTQYITNGIEILKEVPWDGQYIPIIPFWGQRLYVNNELILKSLPRQARSAAAAMNYCGATIQELTGQMPKAPFVAATGQFDGLEKYVETVNRIPIPVLYYNPEVKTPDGTLIAPGPPQRAQMEPAVQALMGQWEMWRQAIRSAMGLSPLPTSAQRLNEKSGVALNHIQESTEVGAFHLIANYKLGIENTGKVIDDLLPSTFTTPRKMTLRHSDGNHEITDVNPDIFSKHHEVTIQTGPAFASQKDKVSDVAMGILNNNGVVEAAIGGNVIAQKLTGTTLRMLELGPMSEKLIDTLDPSSANKEEEQMPPQAQMALQQLQQALQEAQAKLQFLEQERIAKQSEIESKEKIALLENATRKEIAEMDNQTKLLLAHQKGEEGMFERTNSRIIQQNDHQQLAAENEADRAHAKAQAEAISDQNEQQE